ncbi:ABC transporter permease [Pararhodospirillum oryzae]|uniref:Molybdenum ABC transporter permease n=1 Tax=Pararhodospirillum oryzae TaxID=478448 RepID=A0A512H3X7_9PROT|nr:ABC transporter permease [Pararhodospirillum oryzae]GEO80172.1 molybdenum ABC transporter permease [Pararhodospirillum oryzae]
MGGGRWLAGLALALIVLTIVGAVVALAAQLAPAALWTALGQRETLFAVGLSLRTSAIALALALLLGVPAAYLLARHPFPGQAIVETVLDLPMVTPPLIAGMGLLFLLGREAPLGHVLADAGLTLLFSPAGVILAQTYVATSIVVRSARAAFQAVDPDFAAVGATLGLAPVWVFLLVEVPMAGRGLLSAAVLGWSRALGEFGGTLMVAGATRLHTETLPMAVFLNIASGETEIAIACALVLLGLAFVMLLTLRALAGEPSSLSRKPARHARLVP